MKKTVILLMVFMSATTFSQQEPKQSSKEYNEKLQTFFEAFNIYYELKQQEKIVRKSAKENVPDLLYSLLNAKSDSLVAQPKNNKKQAGPEGIEKGVIGYFDFNSFNINESFYEPLLQLANKLKGNKNFYVELNTHADARGSTKYNMQLTEKRLNTIKTYLIKTGVFPSQISGITSGKSVILNKCINGVDCEDNDHNLNRRVSYKLMRRSY
jgi:outer membrane protein OmpA-like peptidoglycan-associated protein